jgi:hypothetical protein
LRLVRIDRTCADVADTEANKERFGRPDPGEVRSGRQPQLRLVGLGECATHAMFAAAHGQ